MQFKALTVLALSALVIASPELEKRQNASTTENPTELSVLSVLATALPPSLLAIGYTNAPEVGSIIASAFSAGQTPAWYSALPSDVKSYLPILYSEEAPTTTPLSISAGISSSLNTTAISSVQSASLKATTTAAGSVTGSASSAGASSTSSGGASYPSAVVGAGVAGALGLLGMLAL